MGIATAGDSFDRLIKHGHKKRMEILINEPQRHPGSRVSDETFLFLFEVESTGIQTFDEYDDFDDFSLGPLTERKQVVADAEKAFIKMLDPSYNEVKYRNYPAGFDGLHGSGLVRYGYSIAENIIFKTGFATIQGALDPVRGFSNGADVIFIEGDTVKHFVSGVDFPSD